jgi:hypothetical protein
MDYAELCLVDFGFCIQMPTAISAVPTLDGFVIGSDGRSCGLEGEIKSDEVRKIFSISHKEAQLAYALMGEVSFGHSGVAALFDFGVEVPSSVRYLGAPSTPWEYLGRLAVELRTKFNLARGALRIEPTEGSETTIVVGGFYGKMQGLGYVTLKHNRNSTEESVLNFPPGASFPFGSVPVVELMHAGDPRFAQYARPSRIGLKSLRDGIERVRKDILIHYDPEARRIDEKACSHIGGRIQIATVTLADGFRWVPGFEAASTITP